MQLLVSVRDVCEALDALAGGADVIDVKEPAYGALGVAAPDVARAIGEQIAARRPVSIVLGDLADPGIANRAACRAHSAGASIVKLGLAGFGPPGLARDVLRAAISGAAGADTAVVAYGDADRAGTMAPERVVELAVLAGAQGVVFDTFDKTGPSLFAHLPGERLEILIDVAHGAGLFVGLAGKLGRAHIGMVRELGADLFGVRGAVCDMARTARLSRTRVHELSLLLRRDQSVQLAVESA